MIIKRENKIRLGYLGEISSSAKEIKDRDIINMFQYNEPDESKAVNMETNHRVVCNQRQKYYLFDDGKIITLFRKLPMVYDTEVFRWRNAISHNQEQKYKLATIKMNCFGFACHFYEDTDLCDIEVRLIKGYGSCKIGRIQIENADNDKILNACVNYRDTMAAQFIEPTEAKMTKWGNFREV